MEDRHILVDFLLLAVPLQMMKIKSGEVEFKAPRPDISRILGEKGDLILYGGKGAGRAVAFLVEGLATLAFAPGGVTAFGIHFEDTLEEAKDVNKDN